MADAIAHLNRAVEIREEAYEDAKEALRTADAKANSAAAAVFARTPKVGSVAAAVFSQPSFKNSPGEGLASGGEGENEESGKWSLRSSRESNGVDPLVASAARQAVKANSYARKCQGAVAGTLYNRGLLYQQVSRCSLLVLVGLLC